MPADTPSPADASADAARAPSVRQVPQPGDAYAVPAAGSLGLLALGARGLDAWRAKREAVRQARANATASSKDAPASDAPTSDAPASDAPASDAPASDVPAGGAPGGGADA